MACRWSRVNTKDTDKLRGIHSGVIQFAEYNKGRHGHDWLAAEVTWKLRVIGSISLIRRRAEMRGCSCASVPAMQPPMDP